MQAILFQPFIRHRYFVFVCTGRVLCKTHLVFIAITNVRLVTALGLLDIAPAYCTKVCRVFVINHAAHSCYQ